MNRLVVTATCISLATALASAQRGPAPSSTDLSPDVLAIACAPATASEPSLSRLSVTGGQDAVERGSYAPGDLVTINAGINDGIAVGQEYYTRRTLSALDDPAIDNLGTIKTSGWLRVYAVDPDMALATISHACDTIDVGDYLEPFAPPIVTPGRADAPAAQRSNYARILFGADRRESLARGDFFVIDHGSDHGVATGARFVVYHDKQSAGNFLYEIGEAVAVDVKPDTATLQVTLSRSALSAGDYVAIQR